MIHVVHVLFLIYYNLLDISTIIYHLLLNISTGHISSTVVVVCSWRKVQSRWNRTTMLYLLNISTGLIFLSAHIIIRSTADAGVGERCEAVGSVQLRSGDPHHKVGAGGEKWSHIIFSSASSGLIDNKFSIQLEMAD